MSGYGGIISMMVGGAVSDAAGKISSDFRDVATKGGPFTKSMSKDMVDWAQKDWDNFKTNYRPVGEALATDALRAPNYAGAQGKVSADVAAQSRDAGDGLVVGGMRRGVDPSSGSAHAGFTEIAHAQGGAEGEGYGLARRAADEDVFNKRMSVLNTNSGSLGASQTMGGKAMDLENLGARRYLKMSDSYGGAAGEGMASVGRGIGKASSLFKDNSGETSNATFGDGGNYGYDADSGKEGWADGGLIRGPGTGRSDSIPAKIDGVASARVANGEYRVPGFVVRYFGTKFFDELNARYGSQPQDAAMAGGDA